ncbi:hypothetical protein Aperf_G00000086864 [Anoplocephala perfoliata]
METDNAQNSERIVGMLSNNIDTTWATRSPPLVHPDNTDQHISFVDHPHNTSPVISEFSFLNYIRNHFGMYDLKVKTNRKLKSLLKSGPDVSIPADDESTVTSLEKSKVLSVSDSMVQLRGGILRIYQNIVRNDCSSSSSSSGSSLSSSGSSSCIDSSDTTDEYTHSAARDDDSSSDSVSTSELELSPPEPPDGGWGWVIVFAAFFIQMIDDGVAVSFGIFLDDLSEEFATSLSVTSWVGAFGYGIPCLAAPLASMLINRFHCRIVCIYGGLISAIGCALAFFIESMLGLVLTFGVLVGFGASLSSTAALIIVSLYFDDRRATAIGLSIAGSGVGSFVFAPLVNYLINVYTWRGAMLVLAGIFTHIVIFGCLMRPIETGRQRRKRQLLLRMENFAKESGFKLPEVYLKSNDGNIDQKICLLRKLLTSPHRHSSTNSNSNSSVASVLLTTTNGGNDSALQEEPIEIMEEKQPTSSRPKFPDIPSSAAASIYNALALIPPALGRTKRSIYHHTTAIQQVTESQLRFTFSMPDLQGSAPSTVSELSAASTSLARVLHGVIRVLQQF